MPFAHSMLTALRHPGSACQQRRLPGHGEPEASRSGCPMHHGGHAVPNRIEPVLLSEGWPSTAGGFGPPVPQEPALLTSAARMAERGQHRVSEGQDARSERPAMGHGWPEAGLGPLTTDLDPAAMPTSAPRKLQRSSSFRRPASQHRERRCRRIPASPRASPPDRRRRSRRRCRAFAGWRSRGGRRRGESHRQGPVSAGASGSGRGAA